MPGEYNLPGEGIEGLVADVIAEIEEARPPFGQREPYRLIDADKILNLLDDIRMSFPEEFQKARRILRERDEMLDSAEQEADHIVKDATDKAELLASEQEIVRRANDQAVEIRRRAEEEAREIRYWAENAAEQTFSKIEQELEGVIEKTRGLLSQMTYCREILSGKSDDAGSDADEPRQDD